MVRGTTPTHVFSGLPVLSTDIQQVWVSYQQSGRVILTKDINDVAFDDNLLSSSTSVLVSLSQEDTLSFKPGMMTVQLRILLWDGTAMASEEIESVVTRITKDGEIN